MIKTQKIESLALVEFIGLKGYFMVKSWYLQRLNRGVGEKQSVNLPDKGLPNPAI